jgi:hypothetical protein
MFYFYHCTTRQLVQLGRRLTRSADMIMEEFDPTTLANMQLALEQASKQFPARLWDHEGRRGVACELMDLAKEGHTALQPLAQAAVSAASSLVDRQALTSPEQPKARMPAAGPHARLELTDGEKTPGCGMLPSEDDTNPSPTG